MQRAVGSKNDILHVFNVFYPRIELPLEFDNGEKQIATIFCFFDLHIEISTFIVIRKDHGNSFFVSDLRFRHLNPPSLGSSGEEGFFSPALLRVYTRTGRETMSMTFCVTRSTSS